MKKLLFIFLTSTTCLSLVSSPAFANSVMVITEDDNKKSLEVCKGDILSIELPIQYGPGYYWKLDAYDKSGVKFLEEKTKNPEMEFPGIPSLQIFNFEAIDGLPYIKLKYIRLGEKNSIKVFYITFNIKSCH